MPPDFERWELSARQDIDSKEKLCDMANTIYLNESTRSTLKMVLLSVERGFEQQNNKIRDLNTQNELLSKKIQQTTYLNHVNRNQQNASSITVVGLSTQLESLVPSP